MGSTVTLRPIRAGAWLKVPKEYELHKEEHFRSLLPASEVYPVEMHASCRCNELISLRNRVLQAVPTPCNYLVREARPIAHRIARWLGRHEPADAEWIEVYRGRKRTMYAQAYWDLTIQPLSRRDRFVKSFIKAEKVSDITRDPRMIQARNPRYNIELGNYLKPIEHKLYNLRGTRCLEKLLPRGRLIAKGLNHVQRAELLRHKMRPNTVCISLDASRFDAHVSIPLLTLEHAVYLGCYPGDRKLQKLLSYQLVNHGWTKNGIRYKCPGGRMSGDMNTALGNCLLMVIMTATVMRHLGFRPRHWDMLCDGDDTLLFLPKQHLHALERIIDLYCDFGMEMKVDNITENYHDILFCQCKPVTTDIGDRMVQNPDKITAISVVSNKHFLYPQTIDAFLTVLGKCYLSVYPGVPILQAMAECYIRNGHGAIPKDVEMSGIIFRAMREVQSSTFHDGPVPISEATRLSFEAAWGYTPAEQRAIESHYEHLVL